MFELALALYKLATPALFGVLIAPLVLYGIVKWRAARDPAPDPQLGFKFVLYYFATVAFQLALLGAMLLIYSILKPGGESAWPEESKGGSYRMAFGLIVPALLVLGAHIVLLSRTNDAQHPAVRRLFIAFNLMIVGVFGLAALVVGFQALFAKGSAGGLGHAGFAGIVVYCTTWALLGWRYHQLAIGGSVFGGDDVPDVVLPSSPDAPAPKQPEKPAKPAEPGLPSLGGGSFPPIEPPK